MGHRFSQSDGIDLLLPAITVVNRMVKMTNTEQVKNILKESTGARDFLRRATQLGFTPDGTSMTGSYYKKGLCTGICNERRFCRDFGFLGG